MFKKTLTLLLAILNSGVFSQEITSSIPIELKKDRDIFQIVDEGNKTVALFLSDKKRVNAIKLDESLRVTDSISSPRPEDDYIGMIGYIQNNNQYKLFWSSGNSKEILIQTFDFNSRKTTTSNFKFKFKEEKVIQSFSDGGKFYIVSVLKNSNTLKFYIFDTSDALSEKTIELENYKFFLSRFEKSNLYGVLGEGFSELEKGFSVQRITTESPTSLTYSSKKKKCYVEKGVFTISIDTNPSYTQLISITLSDFSAKERIFKMPFIKISEFRAGRANSFLLDEKLFQMKLTSDEIAFSIKDMNGNVLKEYSTQDEDEIQYRNSDIIQEKSGGSNERSLKRTNQFLRKVDAGFCGISGYKLNDQYLLKIGSVSEQQNTGAMYGVVLATVGGGLIGGLVFATLYNPTFDNFNSYADRKVVYFNSIFDVNGNHLTVQATPIAFDKIQNYIEENNRFASPTVFKMANAYYFGNYNKKTKTYEFRKFID